MAEIHSFCIQENSWDPRSGLGRRTGIFYTENWRYVVVQMKENRGKVLDVILAGFGKLEDLWVVPSCFSSPPAHSKSSCVNAHLTSISINTVLQAISNERTFMWFCFLSFIATVSPIYEGFNRSSRCKKPFSPQSLIVEHRKFYYQYFFKPWFQLHQTVSFSREDFESCSSIIKRSGWHRMTSSVLLLSSQRRSAYTYDVSRLSFIL